MGVDCGHCGLPDPTVAIHVEPGSVGGEGTVEDLVGDPGTLLDDDGPGDRDFSRLFGPLSGRLDRWGPDDCLSVLDRHFPGHGGIRGRQGTLADHRSDDAVGNTHVMEKDDLIRCEARELAGLIHMSQQDHLAHTGFVHLQHFRMGGRESRGFQKNRVRFDDGRRSHGESRRRSRHGVTGGGVAATRENHQSDQGGCQEKRRLHVLPSGD